MDLFQQVHHRHQKGCQVVVSKLIRASASEQRLANSQHQSTSKCWLVLLLLITLLLGSTPAIAKDYMVLNTLSLHFKNADERRAFTPGLGWEYSPSHKLGYHVGTASDSFGYQAVYGGLNWATNQFRLGKTGVRFILGATVLHKQFHKNSDAETKIVPFPVIEFELTKQAKLNLSGSPELDVAGFHNNTVLFLQFKWNTWN